MVNLLGPILTSLFSGLVAIGCTIAIEKLGPVGGLIGTTPTTIVPASIGLAYHNLINGTHIIEESLYSSPFAMLVNNLYLVIWRELPRTLPAQYNSWVKLTIVATAALFIWFLIVTSFVVFAKEVLRNAISDLLWLGLVMTFLQLGVGVASMWFSPKEAKKSKVNVGIVILFCRGLLAAAVTLIGILISDTNPVAAGIALCFPAIFTTTMVSLWLSYGAEMSVGAAGPMMLGAISVSVYCLAYPALFVKTGPLLGALFTYIVAIVLGTIPTYFLLKYFEKRDSKQRSNVREVKKNPETEKKDSGMVELED